jgi:hypothetical protein
MVDIGIGSGVALGTLFVSAGAVCITAIKSKSNGHGNGKQCKDHADLCAKIAANAQAQIDMNAWLNKVEKKLDDALSYMMRGGRNV